jgi:YidC/Oxa1 family membrane protein insertase
MNPWNLLLELLGNVMAFFYSLIPNYGIAIILLTLAISILMFPLTLKQTRSMKAMQAIQPEVKKLQKEYRDDREELNKQLMALYQEHGVNPAAGCLPLLVQMPIWFALFSVLRIGVTEQSWFGRLLERSLTAASVDASLPQRLLSGDAIPQDSALADSLIEGKSSFLSMDLLISPADAFADSIGGALPYLILIALVVATGFYQTIQTTRARKDEPPKDKQAQNVQMVTKVFPLLLGVFSWGFPTGLVLYFAVSGLFRVGQQAYILRLDEQHAAQAAAVGGTAGGAAKGGAAKGGAAKGGAKAPPPPADTGGSSPGSPSPRAPGSRPSPHASKKRKKRRRK